MDPRPDKPPEPQPTPEQKAMIDERARRKGLLEAIGRLRSYEVEVASRSACEAIRRYNPLEGISASGGDEDDLVDRMTAMVELLDAKYEVKTAELIAAMRAEFIHLVNTYWPLR